MAIDSVKIGAQNSKKDNYNEKKVKQHLSYLDQQINEYLADLEYLDQEEQPEEEQIVEVAQKLDQLIEGKKKYEGLKEDLQEARSKGETQISTSDPDYVKEKFIYDPDRDSYQCPAGQELKTNGNQYKKNSTDYRKVYRVKVYKLPFEVCNSCPEKLNCAGVANLKNSKGRPIERSEYEDVLEANRERVKLNKDFYRKRKQIVEHPFGTIKRQWGYHYTLLKTKKKVEAEMSLIFTCYNLRRSMSIFGVKDLIKRLESAFLEIWMLTALMKPRASHFSVMLHSSTQRRSVS